jgi:hypothetical protein
MSRLRKPGTVISGITVAAMIVFQGTALPPSIEDSTLLLTASAFL